MARLSQITLDALVKRATSGQTFNRHRLFRPSLSYYLLTDPFWIWCQYHAPKAEAVDETTRYEELRMQQGVEYEKRWVNAHFPDAVEIKPSFGFAALKNTLRAMLDGAAVIYQPQLWDLGRDSYGKGDLLIRDDSAASDLGRYHYRVVEIKGSQTLRPYHVLQAAFYNQNVALLQGYAAQALTIVLRQSSSTVPYDLEAIGVETQRRLWQALRDGTVTPETQRPPNASGSPWRHYGNKFAATTWDLILLAGVPRRERDRLRDAGIARVDQLWRLPLAAVSEIIGERYGNAAFHVAQAYKINGPILKAGHEFRIPRAKRPLYFDFETSDGVHPTEPPHTYLIGCYDGDRDQFVKFLARGGADESRIFEDFFDYVGDLREVLLYHWTDFEIHQLRRVGRRWPALRGSIERLTLNCVDLKEAIQAAVYLPVPSFSIKAVAPALGFHWRQKDVGAYQSMVCYWDYLENRDLFAIQRAILYNEDDCRAMWHVHQALAERFSSAESSRIV